MASNNVSNALIPYTTDINIAAPEDLQVSRPRGKWDLLLRSLLNPSPGRTLNQVYISLGKVLEKRANRAAHGLGFGPHVVAQKIKSHFGKGEDRVQYLGLIRSSIPDILEKKYCKLMKYTLPVESAKTQFQAFKDVVDLVTLFPGLRVHFLRAMCRESTSADIISALWDRPTGPPDEEWIFWQSLAATCLSDTTISAILEESNISQLTSCDEGSLSVIERLLVEHDCAGTSNVCGALSIRYLAGILDLPGFWLDTGNVHSDVAKKLCSEIVRILKDIGADLLTLGPINESDASFDYDGIDFFATTVLTGLSSWFAKCNEEHWALQLWYTNFRTFLNILRGPRSADLLPNAAALATSAFESILPTVHQYRQVNIVVVDIPRESGILENEDIIHNGPLLDLNSTDAAYTDMVEEEDQAESRGSAQENDTDSQIENAESPSSAGLEEVGDAQIDISAVLLGAGNDDEEQESDSDAGSTESQRITAAHGPTTHPIHKVASRSSSMQAVYRTSWGVSSPDQYSSVSKSDAFVPPLGPSLGKCLRGPLSNVAGLVFGGRLQVVAGETSVTVGGRGGQHIEATGKQGHADMPLLKLLEHRMLPALVVRCAQHILTWGVQEEGLFRVTGRPSHISKLRQEFDTGADYDMTGCTPGELDPHAVASVFKAFLRELPEPILSLGLIPYFEAALVQESSLSEQDKSPRMEGPEPSLPSGPRNVRAMRKPPSLSTLAMPNFNSLHPPSQSLLNTLQSLIGQLPPENRDLIRTVTELIRATAKQSRETKMPLSNLLLVFCPNLNINPPLLRVLCEAEGLWGDDESGEPEVVDIKRESALDIQAPETPEVGKPEVGEESDIAIGDTK